MFVILSIYLAIAASFGVGWLLVVANSMRGLGPPQWFDIAFAIFGALVVGLLWPLSALILALSWLFKVDLD